MLDPISDMLTRIRNAQRAGHSNVVFPVSKFKKAIAEVLLERDFIDGIKVIKGKSFDSVSISLKYNKEDDSNKLVPAISQIKRVSKEGQRIYVDKESTRKVKNGYGVAVVSTSKGVMSGEKARKEGIGGELICEIW
jgi:small subunit ribosomal protein S8